MIPIHVKTLMNVPKKLPHVLMKVVIVLTIIVVSTVHVLIDSMVMDITVLIGMNAMVNTLVTGVVLILIVTIFLDHSTVLVWMETFHWIGNCHRP